MRVFFNRIKQVLNSRLWAWPLVTGILGAALGVLLTSVSIPVDAALSRFLWPGDSESAASMISFIASTLLTVLTTTISMTLIVLQVASGTFSHQLLRDFISSRAVRGILGVYVGLFSYTVMVGRALDTDDEIPPQLAMTVAMVGIFVAVATFIWYVSRVVDMVRADTILSTSASRTLKLAKPLTEAESEDLSEEDLKRPEVADDAIPIRAGVFGFVQSVDVEHAADWAREHDSTVVIDIRPGDSVLEGQPMGWYWGGEEEEAPEFIYIGEERASGSDFSLGLQQILDIAVRALGTSTNDPTTVTHAIGHGGRILRELAANPLEPKVRFDKHKDEGEEEERRGRLLVWAATRTTNELLSRFVGHIRRYASGDVPVLTRLLLMLDSVDHIAQDSTREVINEERKRIVNLARASIEEEYDLNIVLEAAHWDHDEEKPNPDDGDISAHHRTQFEV
ncbi:putative membrane protein [Trueperella bonasi]|uniref:Membrane protein n=1 Tax=Trueperella bonasi TaxID=312286 RepID=A0ABT9NGN3_9ACTO|nr:DUF2254 domain-containing protein [Trueperella bonasi]MDP9806158.1 putative membrane protein [Trueperella bonasi]